MTRAALAVLCVLALAGCSAPEPTSIEVYVEPPASQPDGAQERTGTCSGAADYEAHVQALAGSVEVTVVDGGGAEHHKSYSASGADKGRIDGPAGTWTVRVTWTGFRGSVHAGLLC